MPMPVPGPMPVRVAPTHPSNSFAPAPPVGGDYSLRRIIELYGEQADLLRVVLSAKTEQDRARAEYERRVQEEWRYETRRVEFEMMLHGNYFKQQEREYEQQQQQQNRHMGVVVSGGMHREIHSPIGPLQQQQQQQPPLSLPPQGAHHHPQTPAMATPAGYGSSSHDHYRNVRSYHHPDTPGGLDGRSPNPFAFFKMPLGAPLHHPSAYSPQQKPRPPMRDRKVAPAISGLSVRIVDHGGNIDGNVPQSAPVDGPAAQAKRKISHDEVIMALRRKVMAKSGSNNNSGGFGGYSAAAEQTLAAASAATSTVSAPVSATAAAVARQSSLGIITNVAEDVDVEEAVALSSSSSESSDASVLAAINEGRRGDQQQQQRLPSISDMLESESGRSS
ncbi:hypothetical protein LPJ66_000314 [Kickxella alabastrina]|uniref:Uncharacterized protein n=1 Tax=Kickxella alabastrina TaxID=61397 RepID=A0ACC1IWH3_9FUNG|nr:hypothetical protein LPJ66_000314 [Kickxella alabastrina]